MKNAFIDVSKQLKQKLKRIRQKANRNLRKIIHSFDKNIVFSIGENCLVDDILQRNKLKSFSSPYASGRSNIEYILAFEKENFKDFLNPNYLQYELFGEKRVVRNKKYVKVVNKYHPSVTNGFEFTHHDVLNNNRSLNSISRRCERLKKIKNKNLLLVYHHRLCKDTNIDLLTSHIVQLEEIYKHRGNTVHSFIFTQAIIANADKRRVEKEIKNGVNFYTLYTNKEWCGKEDSVFWARCDDDLLRVMIDDIKKSKKQK